MPQPNFVRSPPVADNSKIWADIRMLFFLNISQIVISLLLVATILLQQRGGGLSPVFGGEGGVYRTRRGMEKIVFWATVILAILFLLTAILNIVIR